MTQKNFEKLDEKLDEIESQIRCMKRMISEKNAPEETKKVLRKHCLD